MHDFQGYFSQDFPGPKWFSMTFQVLEFSRKNQDFPGGVGTLIRQEWFQLYNCNYIIANDTKMTHTHTPKESDRHDCVGVTVASSSTYDAVILWIHRPHTNDVVLNNKSKMIHWKLNCINKQASIFICPINKHKDIISMNNVQGQAARKAHKAQHCWPPCKKIKK